ncbi:MAG: extracellular solute-binding protein, partial [Rhodospirillaceae bacterium]|nr:extracellular solute-binding protein [Rhodospirillaceae bacterium]
GLDCALPRLERFVAVAILQGVTDLMRCHGDSGEGANVKPVADLFTERTGVQFRLNETPVDEINSQMIIDSVSGGGTFDLALPATFGVPDLVAAGALKNLDGFAKKYEPRGFQDDALFSLGDYYKGSLYGYQTDGDTYLMFYKKDCLESADEQKRFADKYGFPLKLPRTWRELDAQMAFFHRPDKDMFGGALFRTPTYIAWEFWIRFHAKGYWPFDTALNPQINNDAGVEALEELIAASSSLYDKARTNGLFDNWKAFAAGNIYCNIGWGGTQKFLNSDKSKIRGNLLYAPTPGGTVDGKLIKTPYFNWGWNYTVSSTSAEAEIAYLFALFACSPEMSTKAVREASGFFDPFRSAHYEDPDIRNTYTPEFLSAHKESMAESIPDLYLPGQGEYFSALRENLVRADSGQQSAKRALDLTAQQWEQTTRRLGRKAQAEQWAFLRNSYPETTRLALR